MNQDLIKLIDIHQSLNMLRQSIAVLFPIYAKCTSDSEIEQKFIKGFENTQDFINIVIDYETHITQ